jgi:hypothetical protein
MTMVNHDFVKSNMTHAVIFNRWNIPFKAVLSSNNRPKYINRMLLGLLGCASHSSLHSLNINSFNVYTLMLNGSFFPADVVPGTFTFRFVRYFSSILYGCRAPEVSSNVMTRTGPASLATTGVSIASGPIAIESSLVITGGEAGAELVAGVVETGVACCLPVNNGGSFDASAADDVGLIVGAGFVFSLATPDSLVVEWKVEPK